ncbi:hypothetical protein BDY19DRAFT_921738 [Irpex rosettiformis]|uniref:Uncharacterized protein n=1 Tax=Irpex rosettiformis TaxID=378272 RepID=A0ACB8UFI4_9APHY|nr:hypothetical protein BDY19DRAFT_921738 [Irpex rosettiformis]
MSYYGAPVTIVPANLVLRYPVGEVPNTDIPAELRPYYKEDVWASRITAACRKANRYHKKGLEWIYLFVGLGSLIALPIATYFLAYNALPDDKPKEDDKKDGDDDHHFLHFHAPSFNRYWKARLIAFAVWLALMFLVFVPMHMWKRKGKTAVNQLLGDWEREDSAIRPTGMPAPSLRMKMPGVVDKNIKFVVTFPPVAPSGPSMYQPGSNIPPYIANPPSDPAAQAYYQQPPYLQNGAPPTSQMGQASGFVGQAPMGATPYDPRTGAGYNSNRPAENPFGDEKAPRDQNPFEDVKV